MTLSDGPLTLTISAAVAATGIQKSNIYALLVSGDLKAVKFGRKTLITADSLRSYIANLPTAEYKRAA